jgi:hypothetical protein
MPFGQLSFIAAFALAIGVSSGSIARAQSAQPPPPGIPVTAPSAAFTEPPAIPLVTASPTVNEPSPTPTAPTGRRLAAFHITANRITFYSNRYIVGADGNVDVLLGDGTRVRGNTFAMDLRLNRFVIAGNVKVTAEHREIDGAAFAEYFNFDRAYFVPILSEPDRWTFAKGDYAHPLLGREMPGDTFFLPELTGERAFLYAQRATVDPNQSVRFAPARINFGLTFLTFPTYFLNFSPNPNFAQNALEGADIDGPLDFAGGEHALATAHVRYDSVNKVYLAYEQHQVSENHYLVFSINPLTRPFKQYNLLGYDRLSPGLAVQLSLQESAYQYGFSQPLSAVAFANLQITGSLPHSYLQFSMNAYYDSLLAPPPVNPANGLQYYGSPDHNFVPYHPDDLSLSWIGYKHRINDLPLEFQLRSGIGFSHDGLTPIQTLGNVNIYSLYDKSFGANLATKQITLLKDRLGRHRDIYFTGSFDKQREYFSLPHHIDQTTTSLSITKYIDPQRLAVLVAYTNQNIGDFYGPLQAIAYPLNPVTTPYISPLTGLPVPGYNFQGFATTRSLIGQLVFTPNPDFAVNFSMRSNRDFPRPIAGPILGIGDTLVFNNYGQAPYQANLDVRFRVNRILVLDVGRSYFFNFGGYERFSPQFTFQVQK